MAISGLQFIINNPLWPAFSLMGSNHKVTEIYVPHDIRMQWQTIKHSRSLPLAIWPLGHLAIN